VAGEIGAEHLPEVRLGGSVWRAVVVGQVEVGHSQLEGAAEDRPILIRWSVAAEALP
jgi:hypothetical protein